MTATIAMPDRVLAPVRWPYQTLYRGHVVDAMPEPQVHGLYRAKVLITETDADGHAGYGCVFFPAGATFATQAEAAAYGMSLGRERVDQRVAEIEQQQQHDRNGRPDDAGPAQATHANG